MYLFVDVCLHIIDCLSYTTAILAFKLAQIRLETTLSMVKQLQYWRCEICNVKQSWIFWSYGLSHTGTVYNHNDVILGTICYIYICCIIVSAIYSNRNHKLHINGSDNHESNQNKIIGYILETNIVVVYMIVNYYKRFSNVRKVYQLHRIINKIYNFQYNGYIDMFLSITDALHSISAHKLHINGSGVHKLSNTGIIEFILDGSITAMFIIITYDIFATKTYKMKQFYQMNDIMDDLNLIITAVNVIDTLVCQHETLIAIYVIMCQISLFVFTHGTFTLAFKFIISHSKTTNLFTFHVTTCKIIKFYTVGVIGIQIVASIDNMIDNNDGILSKTLLNDDRCDAN